MFRLMPESLVISLIYERSVNIEDTATATVETGFKWKISPHMSFDVYEGICRLFFQCLRGAIG